MTLTEQQLEWVVQEVIRRLKAAPGAAAVNGDVRPATSPSLVLAERLVTMDTLKNRLAGITRVEVTKTAIVTPAVVDLLKDRKVQLVRATGAKG